MGGEGGEATILDNAPSRMGNFRSAIMLVTLQFDRTVEACDIATESSVDGNYQAVFTN